MEIKYTKIQAIRCYCGNIFSGCKEPECYTEKEYLKDLKNYVKDGYKIEMLEQEDFKFEKCTCPPVSNEVLIPNQLILF